LAHKNNITMLGGTDEYVHMTQIYSLLMNTIEDHLINDMRKKIKK